MRNVIALLGVVALLTAGANATVLVDETFDHPDGPLVGNTPTPGPGGVWTSHSGTVDTLLVESGAAVLTPSSTSSEDANTGFGTQTSGTFFYGFQMTVTEMTGTPDEYFAHFKDDGTDFTSRLHMEAPTQGGDYTLGISGSSSAPDAVWASDLTFSVTYQVVVGFDFSSGVSTLWIDPTNESSTNIVSLADSVPDLESFAFRQSTSGGERIVADNLLVATTFDEVVVPEPMTMTLLGIGGACTLLRHRRRK